MRDDLHDRFLRDAGYLPGGARRSPDEDALRGPVPESLAAVLEKCLGDYPEYNLRKLLCRTKTLGALLEQVGVRKGGIVQVRAKWERGSRVYFRQLGSAVWKRLAESKEAS